MYVVDILLSFSFKIRKKKPSAVKKHWKGEKSKWSKERVPYLVDADCSESLLSDVERVRRGDRAPGARHP